jgi:hypothetical protein
MSHNISHESSNEMSNETSSDKSNHSSHNESSNPSPHALLLQFMSLTSSLSTKRQKTETSHISTLNKGDAIFQHLAAYISSALHDTNRQDSYEDPNNTDAHIHLYYELSERATLQADRITITGVINDTTPIAFAAAGSKNNPNILTQSQMFNAKDMDKFIDVQESEIRGLEKDDVFDYHRLSKLPASVRLLNSIWSYRRKRRPDGTLLKYKLRICADVGKVGVQSSPFTMSL